jgi:hypothetical protein
MMSDGPGAPDRKVVWFPAPSAHTTDVSATIYDFKATSGTPRKQRIDNRWQPAKLEAQPTAAHDVCYAHLEASTGRGITDMSDLVTRLRTHANAFQQSLFLERARAQPRTDGDHQRFAGGRR